MIILTKTEFGFASNKVIKMPKSESKESNMIGDLSLESKLRAMEAEKNYWKTRFGLLKKYGNDYEA